MWNSESSLNAIAAWGVWVGAISGAIAVAAALVGGLAASRASEISARSAQVEISRANARAEEAKADAAKAHERAEDAKAEAARANERVKLSQQARTLTISQIEILQELFHSEKFQGEPAKKVRVSSVEDAEARMFAMQIQTLMQSCGVNIYPTDGGFPSTCVQLSVDARPLVLVVRSLEISPESQHLVHLQHTLLNLGLDVGVEVDASLAPDEGVLHVMRKASV